MEIMDRGGGGGVWRIRRRRRWAAHLQWRNVRYALKHGAELMRKRTSDDGIREEKMVVSLFRSPYLTRFLLFLPKKNLLPAVLDISRCKRKEVKGERGSCMLSVTK